MRKKRKRRSRPAPASEAADGGDLDGSDTGESAEDAAAETDEAEASEDSDPSAGEGEAESAGESAAAESPDEDEAAPEAVAAESPAESDPESEAEPAAKKRRRRSRRSKGADGESEAGADEASADANSTEASDAGDAGGERDPLAEDPDAELSPAFVLEPTRLKSILESLLFAAEKPLALVDLKRLTGCGDAGAIQACLDTLMQDYADRGVALYDVAGGYQFRTHPSNSEYVQRLIAGRPVRLSRAQLETLAIIAYRQPVTRPEIDEIRGVDSGSTIKVLSDRSLIRVLGKKEEPGRPLLYGTSKEFLEFFNLRELRDLPTLREFHELTEESLREVEALDQAGREEAAAGEAAEGGSNGSGNQAEGAESGGDDEPDDDDSSAAAAPH